MTRLNLNISKPPTLTIQNITKTYPGGFQALKGVTLNVTKGMLGLLGTNGAGKTTLMRIIATLLEPDQGTVTFDEIDLRSAQPGFRNG